MQHIGAWAGSCADDRRAAELEAGTPDGRRCPSCGAVFVPVPHRANAIYCSRRCRAAERKRRVGDRTPRAVADLAPLFWSYVFVGPDPHEDCWVWTGAISSHGYGLFSPMPAVQMRAHVFAFEAVMGPVPAGMALHHDCFETRCVNPWHLRPMTIREHSHLHAVVNRARKLMFGAESHR